MGVGSHCVRTATILTRGTEMNREKLRQFYRRMEKVPITALLFSAAVIIAFAVPPRPSIILSRGNFVFVLLLVLAAFLWGRFVGMRKR